MRGLLIVRRVLAALVALSIVALLLVAIVGHGTFLGVAAVLDLVLLGALVGVLWLLFRLLRFVFRPRKGELPWE